MMNFKGAARRLRDVDIARAGRLLGVGEDEVHAIIEGESSGSGFDKNGRPKALYEPHLAYRYSSGATRDRLVAAGLAYPKQGTKKYPPDSYERIQAACAIDETVALKSTSWGIAQILGSNFKACGYASPQSMVQAFCNSEYEQLAGMVKFIIANGLADEVKRHDWAGLARGYNGPNYAINHYDTRLASSFRKWQGIADTPITDADMTAPAPAPAAKPAAAPKPAPAPAPAPAPKPAAKPLPPVAKKVGVIATLAAMVGSAWAWMGEHLVAAAITVGLVLLLVAAIIVIARKKT
jgi:hypothetical protein